MSQIVTLTSTTAIVLAQALFRPERTARPFSCR